MSNTAGRYQAVPGSCENMRRNGALLRAAQGYRESGARGGAPHGARRRVHAVMPEFVRLLMIATLVLLGLCAGKLLVGCGTIPAQVESDLHFAHKAWQQDKRPTLPDDEYAALSETERELYMPASRERARRAFFEQALQTAAHGAKE